MLKGGFNWLVFFFFFWNIFGKKTNQGEIFNSLPNNKICGLTKLKAVADNNEMLISLFDRVDKIVGKGENAGYQHFLLFPWYFQKASLSGSLKVGIVW